MNVRVCVEFNLNGKQMNDLRNKISQSETRLLKIEQSIKSIEDTLRIVKSRLGL